jgi:hypothetical protein
MRPVVVALALAACLAPSSRAEQTFPVDPELPIEFRRPPPRPWRASLATGFEYDSGIAGQTDELFVPLALRLEYGAFSLMAATSLVHIDGERIVGGYSIGNLSDLRIEAALDKFNSDRGTSLTLADIADLSLDETGIGDTLLGLSYAWFDPDSWLPLIELSYAVKIPTGSARDQIGTGKYDWMLQLDLAKQVGPFTPFAAVAYRFNGGPIVLPEQRVAITAPAVISATGETTVLIERVRIPVDDTVEVTIGSSLRVRDLGPRGSLHVGLLYDFQQSPFDGVADDHELVPYLTFELSDRVQFGPYFVVGLSDSAPDWGIASQILVSY